MAAQANPFDVSVIVSRPACMICVWKRCGSSTDWFSRSGTAHRYSPECGLLDTVRPLCYLSSYQDTVWEVNCRHYDSLPSHEVSTSYRGVCKFLAWHWPIRSISDGHVDSSKKYVTMKLILLSRTRLQVALRPSLQRPMNRWTLCKCHPLWVWGAVHLVSDTFVFLIRGRTVFLYYNVLPCNGVE